MKSSEPFHEHPSAAPRLRRVEPIVPAPVRHEHSAAAEEREFEPRYLELPSRRGRYRGRRNLILGVIVLVLCVPFFGWALYLGGPGAAMTLVSCLATATALYVAARLRLFRQRNGGFLALAMVCVVGVCVALLQQAWLAVVRPGHGPELAAAPPTAPVPAPAPGVSANTPPSLVEALGIPPPDPSRGRRAKVLKDSRVEIEGSKFLIRAGDIFPLVSVSDGEALFLAGSQQIKLRQDLVEILQPVKKSEDFPEDSPVPESPRRVSTNESLSRQEIAEINARATRLAIKRYPGIGIANSPENKIFVGKVNELKAADATGYFESPDWPLRLAETIALHEGWKRQDSHVIEDEPAEDERPGPPPAKGPAMSKAPPESQESADENVPENRELPKGKVPENGESPKIKLPERTAPPGDDLPRQ